MADLIKNITYPFYLKDDNFKELSLKALPIKEGFDNNGQELAEFIYCHLNNYELNSYQNVNLKDIKSSISKVDFMFKEPLTLIENFKDRRPVRGTGKKQLLGDCFFIFILKNINLFALFIG